MVRCLGISLVQKHVCLPIATRELTETGDKYENMCDYFRDFGRMFLVKWTVFVILSWLATQSHGYVASYIVGYQTS
jgi:hypothetical protein